NSFVPETPSSRNTRTILRNYLAVLFLTSSMLFLLYVHRAEADDLDSLAQGQRLQQNPCARAARCCRRSTGRALKSKLKSQAADEGPGLIESRKIPRLFDLFKCSRNGMTAGMQDRLLLHEAPPLVSALEQARPRYKPHYMIPIRSAGMDKMS